MFNRFLKPETRYARRMARIARFERPIAGPGDRRGMAGDQVWRAGRDGAGGGGLAVTSSGATGVF